MADPELDDDFVEEDWSDFIIFNPKIEFVELNGYIVERTLNNPCLISKY